MQSEKTKQTRVHPIKVGWITLLFCLLTILTQVGGLVLLLSIFTHRWTDRWAANAYLKKTYRLCSFFILYCLTTFYIIPFLARPFGRVPLPLTEQNHLKPLTFLTCLLNRHYVRPSLKQTTIAVADAMNKQFPGTVINYLDAGFPFFDQFPLFPHLSHHDGKKLDLSFCYLEAGSGQATNQCPSFIGYGICEEPQPDEKNTATFCAEKGYWQYSFLKKMIPQGNKRNFIFDSRRTKALVELFADNPMIGKIFIEPHLQSRLNLTSNKIRFHGCQAVRHDDHIHVQLK